MRSRERHILSISKCGQNFGRSYRGQQISDVGQLCGLMLREVKVAVVPVDAFGDPTGLRVSYAIETSQVEEGLQPMSLFLNNVV